MSHIDLRFTHSFMHSFLLFSFIQSTHIFHLCWVKKKANFFFCKGADDKYQSLQIIQSLPQRSHCTIITRKQPQMVHKQIAVVTLQELYLQEQVDVDFAQEL